MKLRYDQRNGAELPVCQQCCLPRLTGAWQQRSAGGISSTFSWTYFGLCGNLLKNKHTHTQTNKQQQQNLRGLKGWWNEGWQCFQGWAACWELGPVSCWLLWALSWRSAHNQSCEKEVVGGSGWTWQQSQKCRKNASCLRGASETSVNS